MRWAVGVDLGGTNLRAALVDTRNVGDVTVAPTRGSELKIGLDGDNAPERVAARIAEAVKSVCAEAGAENAPVGVGVAGMLRGGTGIVANAPNLGWRDVDLRGLLQARLPGRAVDLFNDVNAIAFGEYAFGAGRGARDVLCVFVGTGIGAGLVVNGQLAVGASNVSGELGHVKVVIGPSARPCGCGARGCVEAYAGGLNIAQRARAELGGGAASRAIDLAGGADKVHACHLDEAARAGDAYANALWDELAPLLGAALANAVTTLNPGRLILGGGVWWGTPALRARVLEQYRALVNRPSGEACDVVDAELGDPAGILGAAALAALL